MENTFFEAPEYPLLDKLKNSAKIFLNYIVVLFCVVMFIKVLELSFSAFNGSLPRQDVLNVVIQSILSDLIYFIKSVPILYLLFLLMFFSLEKRPLQFAISVLFSLYLLFNLLLLKYFFTALVPLGADLYSYSFSEITQTVAASSKIDLWTILLFLFSFGGLWVGLKYVNKVKIEDYTVFYYLLALGAGLLFFGLSALPSYKSFKTDYAYNFSVNKPSFLLEKTADLFFDNEPEVDIYASNYFDEESDKMIASSAFSYVDENNYPFLRQNNSVDVLGNFFNIDSAKRPNIVIIQVEGLGRAFSGPNSYLGSFTPFLDELRGRSLYWENFLASQDRTFASLPSVLASMPFYRAGFNDLGNKMPPSLTTFNILKKNGYATEYFTGSDLAFDNQGMFLKKQGVQKLISKPDFKDFPTAGSTTWGYADLYLLKKVLQNKTAVAQQPFMSYVQTITMHPSYEIPEMGKYLDLFEKRMTTLGFDEKTKDEHRTYKQIYACIMYTDAALNYFMSEFRKLPYYQNTIFVITGDHRLPEIPLSTKIDRYHVPLIIYSPMLKRTASFKSISTHFDITPSLTAFLGKNYKLQMPQMVTWVGHGLDTVKQFRNINNYPLKQKWNKDSKDFIFGNFFVSDNLLFEIDDKMGINQTTNSSKLSQAKQEMSSYDARNNKQMSLIKLYPDSITRKY